VPDCDRKEVTKTVKTVAERGRPTGNAFIAKIVSILEGAWEAWGWE
jgi:hypothetical protein